MNKLKIVIFIFFVFIGTISQAQKHSFQINAGINASTTHLYDEKNGFNAGYQMEFKYGYNIGALLYLVSGINAYGNVFRNSLTGLSNPPVHFKDKLGINFQIPIHIGYKINLSNSVKLVLQIGPYAAYRFGGGQEITYEAYENTIPEKREIIDIRKRFDFGVGAGLGIEFNRFGINIGYDKGLINVSRNDEKLHNWNLALTFGYRF